MLPLSPSRSLDRTRPASCEAVQRRLQVLISGDIQRDETRGDDDPARVPHAAPLKVWPLHADIDGADGRS